MARRSEKQWKQMVREHDRSGLSTTQFAQQRGLNANTLQVWRWKLGRGGAKRPAQRQTSTKGVAAVRLLPVRVSGGPSESAARVEGSVSRASITIGTGGQLQVDVPLDVDPRDVARLVAALRGVTC
jgi:transposase-like protein